MRKLLIMFFIAQPFVLFGQEGGKDVDRRISTNETRTMTLAEEIEKLQREFKNASTENKKLKSSLFKSNDSLSAVVRRSLEIQAQNERAMNLALDSFKVKFEQQNKTVESVQANLDEKFRNQLMIYILSLAVFVVVVLVVSKSALSKGLRQGVSNWNHFQEHFLKNNK